jgi:hypothetical protein
MSAARIEDIVAHVHIIDKSRIPVLIEFVLRWIGIRVLNEENEWLVFIFFYEQI